MHSVQNEVSIIKSGSEFREFSVIDVEIGESGQIHLKTERHAVETGDIEDRRMAKIVDKYTAELRKNRMLPVIGVTTPIETRFARVRTQARDGK